MAPGLGANELRIRIEFQQFGLKGRQLEEVIFFVHGLGDASAGGAGIAWLRAVHIEFVRDAVLSSVGSLINVAIVANAPEQFLHPFLVALFGGANEVVVRDSHSLPEFAKFRGNLVRVLLWRFAGSLRRTFNLLAV